MRNREVIEREIFRAREDLEQSLAELRHFVQQKIDVRARARVAVERGKMKAQQLLERGKDTARAKPLITGAILAGMVAAVLLTIVGVRRWRASHELN